LTRSLFILLNSAKVFDYIVGGLQNKYP